MNITIDLDELGRCGVAVSNIGKDLMPTKNAVLIGKSKTERLAYSKIRFCRRQNIFIIVAI